MNNVSIIYSDPVWKSPRQGYIDRLNEQISSYTDTVDLTYGYNSASFTIPVSAMEVEDWFRNGLGRNIEVFSPSLNLRWEGFVDEVTISVGQLSVTRGKFMDIVNRVKVRYSDYITNISATTANANNTSSQAIYGIRTNVLSTGKVSSTNATGIRDVYLAENCTPHTGYSVGAGGDLSVTVNCLGYAHLLNYIYSNTATTTYTLREKIIDVLVGEPNSIFSTDYINLAANTLSVSKTEIDDRTGLDIIKSLVAMGPTSGTARMLFGIYGGRAARYWEAPTALEYQMKAMSNDVDVSTITGGYIEPWDITPGKWLELTDFLPGLSQDNVTMRNNPRLVFLESVTFSTPYQVTFLGGKVDTLPQKLAKLGLGGL